MINMMNDTTTICIRKGFWSNDYRHFDRSKVETIERGGYMGSCVNNTYIVVKLESGERIVGQEIKPFYGSTADHW